MATTDLMISDYGRPIRCTAQAAALISARLHMAAPADIDAAQLRALALVAHRADLVMEVQSDRDRVGPTRLRPALSIYANGWSAFFEALIAASRVPVQVSDRGEKATAIVRSLFPDGISCTQLDAESAWSEGNRRLQRVIDEELAEQINQLIGTDFLATATTATAHLGDTIGTGQAPCRKTSTRALQALTAFGRAVGGYGRATAATCNEATS